MSEFYAEMMRSFPPQLAPPEPLCEFFKWQSQLGLAERSQFDGNWYARLDPSQVGSAICTRPVDPRYSQTWTDSDDPAMFNRLAAFCGTGGDGSQAALWLDDEGTIQIVHLGSGSGSTMLGVLTSDPVDFLRLLAIGYDELCWPEQHDCTPDEVFDRYAKEDDEFTRPPPPLALRSWVESTFGVSTPLRASEILRRPPSMDDQSSGDPFWVWDHSFPKWQP